MDCRRCNKEISLERLEVLPDTVLCVQCSAVVGSDHDVRIIEENLGGSIVSKPMIFKIKREIDPLTPSE